MLALSVFFMTAVLHRGFMLKVVDLLVIIWGILGIGKGVEDNLLRGFSCITN